MFPVNFSMNWRIPHVLHMQSLSPRETSHLPKITHSVAALRRSSRAFPKANLHQKKKRSRLLFGGLLPAWSTTAFWIPVNPWHLKHAQANQWDARKTRSACSHSLANRKGSVLLPAITSSSRHITKHFQSWAAWAYEVSLIRRILPTSHQLISTSSSITCQLFAGKMLLQSAGCRKHFQSLNPESWIFTLQTYFSLAKKC